MTRRDIAAIDTALCIRGPLDGQDVPVSGDELFAPMPPEPLTAFAVASGIPPPESPPVFVYRLCQPGVRLGERKKFYIPDNWDHKDEAARVFGWLVAGY